MTIKGDNGRVGHIADGARVYIASRFARRDEMRAIARELEAMGFEVTSRWLESTAGLSPTELEPGRLGAKLAAMDFEDLRRSQLCLAFTEHAEHPRPGRGGRHTELGIALGLGLKVVLVGPREHVFHALPAIQNFPDWSSAHEGLFSVSAEGQLVSN